MAELTQAERAAKYDKGVVAQKNRRLLQKIQLMRVTEAGTQIATSVASGALKAWKPELATALGGFGYVDVATTVGGGLGYLFTKDGYFREAVGGVFMSGSAAVGQVLGQKIYAAIAA